MATTTRLDMTMMIAFHDALRHDLPRVATMTARSAGWDRFTRFLHAHHAAEDEALWPQLRAALGDRFDDLAVLDQMEEEHTTLGRLLDDINGALDRGGSAPAARMELTTRLEEHLTNEEELALPIIDRTLDEAQWMRFGDAAAARIVPQMHDFLPWLLDGADTGRTHDILGQLPDHVQQAYRTEWLPAFTAQDWWGAAST